MWFVYILQSFKNQKYYIGSTDDLFRRVKEHNSGKNISTKNKGPWGLVYQEAFEKELQSISVRIQP